MCLCSSLELLPSHHLWCALSIVTSNGPSMISTRSMTHLQAPEAWLAKRLRLANFSVSLAGSPTSRSHALVLPEASLSLLAPIFAFIDGWETEEGDDKGALDALPTAFVHLAIVEPRADVSDAQLASLRLALRQFQARGGARQTEGIAGARDKAAGDRTQAPATQSQAAPLVPAAAPALARASVASRVWGFITNEGAAAEDEAAETETMTAGSARSSQGIILRGRVGMR